MSMSEEAAAKICEVLGITGSLELDDLLILADAVLRQTKHKSKLRGPAGVIYMNLAERTKRRMREGYVPEDALERIEAAVLG